jgi:hypothetical protein
VCGYDERVDGYHMRKLEKLTADEALIKMEETLAADETRTHR